MSGVECRPARGITVFNTPGLLARDSGASTSTPHLRPDRTGFCPRCRRGLALEDTIASRILRTTVTRFCPILHSCAVADWSASGRRQRTGRTDVLAQSLRDWAVSGGRHYSGRIPIGKHHCGWNAFGSGPHGSCSILIPAGNSTNCRVPDCSSSSNSDTMSSRRSRSEQCWPVRSRHLLSATWH